MSSAVSRAVPGGRRPRRKPGENRAVLLTAGTIEFGLRGFAAAQTSAIARRAGVSQPNVYANFASKQELFLACLGTVAERSPNAQTLSTSMPSPLARNNSGGALVTPRSEEEHAWRLSDAEALLVFQGVACAAVEAASLSRAVRALIGSIQSQLGPDEFVEVLRRAAVLLLH